MVQTKCSIIYCSNFLQNTTKTVLICSDTKNKDKTTVSTFINFIYDNIICVKPDDNYQEIIWSDGPVPEFKNRFMVHTIQKLSKKHNKKWAWKYTATSHGKGVVDGVGGRAKSLVKVLSKAKGNMSCNVENSLDFYNVSKKLLSKTSVFHVDQNEIDKFIAANPIHDASQVPGISTRHI